MAAASALLRDAAAELAKMPDARLADNTYAGAFGADGYGAKASETLLKVRGKDFTKGKQKMKGKAFFGGGAIDPYAVRSVPLNFD